MPPRYDDNVVSPELVLVDPGLRARARAALVVTARSEPEAPALPIVGHEEERSKRKLSTSTLTLVATAVATLVVTSSTGLGQASGETSRPSSSREAARLVAASPAADFARKPPRAEELPSTANATSAVPAAVVTPTTTAPVEPTPAKGPRSGASTLHWPMSAGASAYDVELVRGPDVIFSLRSATPRAVLPRTWLRAGAAYRVQPEDQVFVWPIVAGHRAALPVVDGALALDLTLGDSSIGLGPRASRP